MTEDRSMVVQPGERVRTDWVDIDCCKMACRARMDCAAIERAARALLQIGEGQTWPPVVGEWDGERFSVLDGRHEYLAALAQGRSMLFVAWKERVG